VQRVVGAGLVAAGCATPLHDEHNLAGKRGAIFPGRC